MLATGLLVVSLVLLLLAAFGVAIPYVQAGWLGLAFAVAAELVPLVAPLLK